MKQNIVVFFCVLSSEHVVSCMSAQNVLACIDRDKYEIILVGITQKGRWLLVDSPEKIADGSWRTSTAHVILSPDATEKCLYIFTDGEVKKQPVDVIFPVLHGLFGEDGTIQGLFEMAQIPYVGCGLTSSAIGMDKFYTKMIVERLGIRQAKYVPVLAEEFDRIEAVMDRIEGELPYPVFVKPSRAGSSCGVSKARNRRELRKALSVAAENDRKILVEEAIDGRELECAVLGNLDPKASGVGEIFPADEFYDFDAKYYNQESKTTVSPDLPESAREEIRRDAVEIFKAVDARGLSRVDFFLTAKGVVFNEINTMPGFTAISMYPTLWEAAGKSKQELIQELIDLAFERKA